MFDYELDFRTTPSSQKCCLSTPGAKVMICVPHQASLADLSLLWYFNAASATWFRSWTWALNSQMLAQWLKACGAEAKSMAANVCDVRFGADPRLRILSSHRRILARWTTSISAFL